MQFSNMINQVRSPVPEGKKKEGSIFVDIGRVVETLLGDDDNDDDDDDDESESGHTDEGDETDDVTTLATDSRVGGGAASTIASTISQTFQNVRPHMLLANKEPIDDEEILFQTNEERVTKAVEDSSDHEEFSLLPGLGWLEDAVADAPMASEQPQPEMSDHIV